MVVCSSVEGGLYLDGLIIGCIFCLHAGGPITERGGGGLIRGWANKPQFMVFLVYFGPISNPILLTFGEMVFLLSKSQKV